MKSMIQYGAAGAIVVTSLWLLGCAEAPSSNSPSGSNPPQVVQTVTTSETPGGGTTLPPPPPPPVDATDQPQGEVAQVGFGKKGHYESNDYISVAVSAQFRAAESITLSRIINAMRTYKALNGHYPKTEEVFFKEIIELNGIDMPELPAGQKFQYDPELAKESNGEHCLRILKPKK